MKIDFNTADTTKCLKSFFIFQSCIPTKHTDVDLIQLIFLKQNEYLELILTMTA